MPATAERARKAMARKIVSAVVAPTPTRKPARHDRVTVCEAMIAFTGPGGAPRESPMPMPARTVATTSRTTTRHRAVTFQRGAGILIATATLARADAHRGIDVQPGAVPETGRRGPGSRLRLRRTGPDLDHLGTGETPVRGGRPREAPPTPDRASATIPVPSGGPRSVRRLHRRPRAGRNAGLQRPFPRGAVGPADRGAGEDLLALRPGRCGDGPGCRRDGRERRRAAGSPAKGPRRRPGPAVLPGRRACPPRQAGRRRAEVPRGPRGPTRPRAHP